ncbi:MAG: PKD domain-containing protein, partial [Pseudomonadota bacterium]
MRHISIVLLTALLAGCGGGGGGGGGGGVVPANSAPTANAGADVTAEQNTTVTLNGSASSDSDGSVATYAWTQTAGTAVSLSGADQATATFTAPAVAAAEDLTFSLTVTDDDGASSAADTIVVTVVDALPNDVTISGKAEYEFVNRAAATNGGLDYGDIVERPIRGATVQAIRASDSSVLAATTTDGNGDYALSVPAATDVFIRVRAELKQAGTPSWDAEVRNNTANTGLALAQRPVYALDGAVASSGTADATRDLLAASGWGGSSYTAVRAAAPFSVLDVVYSAVQLVLSVDADAQFAPLDAFWSVNNCPTSGVPFNADTGEIGTSLYRSDIDSLFLLGCADDDTEEFDTHVIAHEWGHYFEDNFSRSDSIGGSHSGSQRLDMRLAFGEGWGNAVAGMILENPRYRDSFGPAQGASFEIDVESNAATNSGWFNEFSVQSVIPATALPQPSPNASRMS